MNSAMTLHLRNMTWRGRCEPTSKRGWNSGSVCSSRWRRRYSPRAWACCGEIGCAVFAVNDSLALGIASVREVCMRTCRLAVFLLMLGPFALAHVGSPIVYFEGAAGPYQLLVTVNPPAMVPGIAQVELRFTSAPVSSTTIPPLY